MKNIIYLILLSLSLISTSFADSVRIIDSGEEAYHVRMQLIESAKEEIQIETGIPTLFDLPEINSSTLVD